jgi:hypothetical protein
MSDYNWVWTGNWIYLTLPQKQQILKQGVAPSLTFPTITPSLSAVGTAVPLVGVNLLSPIKVRVNLQAAMYLE